MSANTIWPKTFPPLDEEHQRISDDFMKYWHQVLPGRYGMLDRFNHTYPVKHAPKDFRRTLEIGSGLGEHLVYELLNPKQEREYHAMDIRANMVDHFRERFPGINVFVGDAQKPLNFPDGYFDRILAIHVLEHLCNLPTAICEMHRLCDKERGSLSIVIPCEGHMAYGLARRISAQRIFEKRYHQKYTWFIEREHINRPAEIFQELHSYFRIVHRSFYPLKIPFFFANLVIGITCRPRVLPATQS